MSGEQELPSSGDHMVELKTMFLAHLNGSKVFVLTFNGEGGEEVTLDCVQTVKAVESETSEIPSEVLERIGAWVDTDSELEELSRYNLSTEFAEVVRSKASMYAHLVTDIAQLQDLTSEQERDRKQLLEVLSLEVPETTGQQLEYIKTAQHILRASTLVRSRVMEYVRIDPVDVPGGVTFGDDEKENRKPSRNRHVHEWWVTDFRDCAPNVHEALEIIATPVQTPQELLARVQVFLKASREVFDVPHLGLVFEEDGLCYTDFDPSFEAYSKPFASRMRYLKQRIAFDHDAGDLSGKEALSTFKRPHVSQYCSLPGQFIHAAHNGAGRSASPMGVGSLIKVVYDNLTDRGTGNSNSDFRLSWLNVSEIHFSILKNAQILGFALEKYIIEQCKGLDMTLSAFFHESYKVDEVVEDSQEAVAVSLSREE